MIDNALREAIIKSATNADLSLLPADFDEDTRIYFETMLNTGMVAPLHIIPAVIRHYEHVTHAKRIASAQTIAEVRVSGVPSHIASLIAETIQSTRLDFEYQFELLLEAVSSLTETQFRNRLYQLLRGFGEQAFRDGMAIGGVYDEIDPDDKKNVIDPHLKEHRGYARKFARRIYSGRLNVQNNEARAAMWFNGSIYPMYTAGIRSASANAMFQWVMDLSKENCKTCTAANGQIHRIRAWLESGIMPKSPRLACGGKFCGCQLIPTVGRARGRIPKAA